MDFFYFIENTYGHEKNEKTRMDMKKTDKVEHIYSKERYNHQENKRKIFKRTTQTQQLTLFLNLNLLGQVLLVVDSRFSVKS